MRLRTLSVCKLIKKLVDLMAFGFLSNSSATLNYLGAFGICKTRWIVAKQDEDVPMGRSMIEELLRSYLKWDTVCGGALDRYEYMLLESQPKRNST